MSEHSKSCAECNAYWNPPVWVPRPKSMTALSQSYPSAIAAIKAGIVAGYFRNPRRVGRGWRLIRRTR